MTVGRGSPPDKTPPPDDGTADPKHDRTPPVRPPNNEAGDPKHGRIRHVRTTNPGPKDPAGRAVEGSQILKIVQRDLMPEDRAKAGEGNIIKEIDQGNMMPEDRATAGEGNLIEEIDQENMIHTEALEGGSDLVNPDDNAVPTDPLLDNPVILEGGTDLVNPDDSAVPTDPQLIENHIITLVTENRWDEVEAYLMKIINAADPLSSHPVLFLHIRRSKLLHFIDTHRSDEAADYFASHVKGPFDKVKELGQENLPFASVRYLSKEITFCGSCVKTNTRKEHPHGPEIMQHVICDYLRMNMPSKIRREDPPTNHRMWRFGIRVPTPPGRKASFRCMVCQHVFKQESIGYLEKHLNSCFMMNTQYLDQLFEACRSNVPGDRVRAKAQRRAHTVPIVQDAVTSPVNIPVAQKPLSDKECVLLFRENLDSAQMINTKLSEVVPDGTWSKLLGTSLANIEVFGNMIISRLGPGVTAAPPALDPVTQLTTAHSGSTIPAAPAQGTHLAVLQSGPSIPAPPSAQGTHLAVLQSGPSIPAPPSAQGTHLAVLQSGPAVLVATSAQPNPGTELRVAQLGQTSGSHTPSLPISAAPPVALASHPLQARTESVDEPILSEGLVQSTTDDNTQSVEATSSPSL